MTDANAAAAKGGKRLELTLRAVVLGCVLVSGGKFLCWSDFCAFSPAKLFGG